MALSLNMGRLPGYVQVGAFVAVAAGITGAFWNFHAAPAQVAIVERQARLEALRTDIRRAQTTADRLPAFRAEVQALEGQLVRLRAVLPEEQDVGDLLRRVQGMATQANLTIRGFTPSAVTRKSLHAEWPYGLTLEGTYHDLGAFLDQVSKFPRIINVGNIRIAARDDQSGGATITAQCTATTFVLVEPKPAAPAAPAEATGQPAGGRS